MDYQVRSWEVPALDKQMAEMVQKERLKASGDLDEIRRWANSPEGVQTMKDVIDWARKKGRKLERSQRVGLDRLERRVTR